MKKTLHKSASSKYCTFYILENIVTLKMLATFAETSTLLPKELCLLHLQSASMFSWQTDWQIHIAPEDKPIS